MLQALVTTLIQSLYVYKAIWERGQSTGRGRTGYGVLRLLNSRITLGYNPINYTVYTLLLWLRFTLWVDRSLSEKSGNRLMSGSE